MYRPFGKKRLLKGLEAELLRLRSRVQDLESEVFLQLDPEFYIAFENRFRGPDDVIEGRVSTYLPTLSHLSGTRKTVLDIGCGRGEMLTVLKNSNIKAIGVDSNQLSVNSIVERGMEAHCGDLLDYLKELPSSSLAAITMLHVVEHLSFNRLRETLRETYRVLESGGILIAETPNVLNPAVGTASFWIDPTHKRPVHPSVLSFLASEAGFVDPCLRFCQFDQNSEEVVSGAHDVALIASKSID